MELSKIVKKRNMNKKGLAGQVLAIIIVMVVFMVMIVGYFFYAMIAPVAVYVVQDASNMVQGAVDGTQDGNLSLAANVTFGATSRTLGNLEWISYSIFIGMLFVLIFFCFFVRTYPFLIIFWILFIILMAFASIYMAITYNDVRSGDSYISAAYQSWEFNDYLLQYLPYPVVAFGLAGGIVLFILASRDEQAEVLL